MCYILVRNLNDLYIQSRNSNLNDILSRAKELVSSGLENNLLVCQEIDNHKAHSKDYWNEPRIIRQYITTIDSLS